MTTPRTVLFSCYKQIHHIQSCIRPSLTTASTISPSISAQRTEASSQHRRTIHYTHGTLHSPQPLAFSKNIAEEAHTLLSTRRPFSTTGITFSQRKDPKSTSTMASDEDYMAFLDKANQDPNEGYTKPQSKGTSGGEFKTLDDGAKVPAAISSATKDAFYISDADEPFVPVVLSWDEDGKGLPDEEEFATLIHHPSPSSAEIEIQDPADWDTQGQYTSILDAVTEAGKGNDVRVYRVVKDKTRVEYWVVTTEGKGKSAKIVGVKALAVES
ncbi:hypothetical protein F5Y16DRAFT_391621 [Xylariaceae sp. FL0255]|nr:hypothetical protein F5Y16DRAFT_391621 [Xylariaceae sp. FL0255]